MQSTPSRQPGTDTSPSAAERRLARTRYQLELQGFMGLDDETMLALDPWLRLAPAICLAWVATATFLGSAFLFWALVPLALAGALFPGHPFDLIYTLGVRPLRGGPAIPRYGAPRRSACAVASVWLFFNGLAFYLGASTLGTILGLAFIAVPIVILTTGFCIPSYLYRLSMGTLGEVCAERG